MWRDLQRICDALSLPFVQPPVFPQNTLLAARVAMVGLAQNWGEDFCRAVYAAEFGESCNVGQPGSIASVLQSISQDVEAVMENVQGEAIKSALRTQTEEAQRLGIFGAPSFVTADGELFWGNDRMESALEWAVRLRKPERLSVRQRPHYADGCRRSRQRPALRPASAQ